MSAMQVAQERGKRGESGSPFCPVTRRLDQATGQAYKLLFKGDVNQKISV